LPTCSRPQMSPKVLCLGFGGFCDLAGDNPVAQLRSTSMPGGFRNQPKVLRGAFVEYGLSFPPLIVLFQFNPLQLSRSRSQVFSVPASSREHGGGLTLRDFHQGFEDLKELRDAQQVTVQPESLSFDIRLDATDKLSEGDAITEQLGIAPQLATLELMV